jgi:hypothetical protein
VTKLLRKNATEYLVSTSQDYNGARGQLTEDEDANEKPDEKQNPVQSLQGLTNILHAFGNRLALLSDFNNLANHLIKRDIAVQITIDGVESFLGLLLISRSKDLLEVIIVQSLTSFDDERHPDTTTKGLRGTKLLQSLYDNGVRRVGVEDLLASDLAGDVAKDRCDLVSNSANISN